MKKIKDFIINKTNSFKEDKASYSAVKYCFMMLGVLGLSLLFAYALYLLDIIGEGRPSTLQVANLDITFTDTADINLTTELPIYDSMKETDAYTNTFSIANLSTSGSNIGAEYEIYLNLTSIDSTLKSSYMKWELLKDDSIVNSGDLTNFNVGDNLLTLTKTDIPLTYTHNWKFRLWMTYDDNVDQMYLSNHSLSGTLKVKATEKRLLEPNSLANMIQLNNPPTTYTTVPGREVSTTDEGLIEGPDDDYGDKTYYFRGTAPDNYVSFAGKIWRVVRINGNGSVRIVLDTATETSSQWNINDTNATWSTALTYATYANSTIKENVETWYDENIGNNTNYSNKVVLTKFCNDRTYTAGTSEYYFGAYNRLHNLSDANPSFVCPTNISEGNDIYNLNVGLLTADEIAFAGAPYGSNSSLIYLFKNDQTRWTMSPHKWNISNGRISTFQIDMSYLDNYYSNSSGDIYPVISLAPGTLATVDPEDPGTIDNPYIVE